jgi:hypothetical protein
VDPSKRRGLQQSVKRRPVKHIRLGLGYGPGEILPDPRHPSRAQLRQPPLDLTLWRLVQVVADCHAHDRRRQPVASWSDPRFARPGEPRRRQLHYSHQHQEGGDADAKRRAGREPAAHTQRRRVEALPGLTTYDRTASLPAVVRSRTRRARPVQSAQSLASAFAAGMILRRLGSAMLPHHAHHERPREHARSAYSGESDGRRGILDLP